MTRQTSAPLKPQHLSARNGSARELARFVQDGDLILDAPYQRGSVWTEDQRVALIKSWILGVPIPAVTLNDRDYRFYAVDGKQRIETAVAWFAGDLAVPASWFPSDVVENTVDTDDGEYVTHKGLVDSERTHQGMMWTLAVVEGKLPTEADEAALYLLVNGGGTAQTDADMANAVRIAAGR